MSIKNNAKITVNGIERYIDAVELFKLSRTYLPKGMAVEYCDKFVNDVIFRIEGLEFDNIDTNGKSIEEYYFAACLCYAEENGFSKFFEEDDDGKIFECCGAELISESTMENKYYKGFNRDGFIEWLEDKHGLNSFTVELLDNIIDYAHKHEHVSKDQFAYFISDLVPEVEFLDVARYCEDGILTRDTLRELGRLK